MPKKTIIFDFDGTIADSFQFVIDLTNQMMVEIGKDPIVDADLSLLRQNSLRGALKKLGLSYWQLLKMVRRGRKAMHDHAADILPFAGMLQLLADLSESGVRLGILTANSKVVVERFLEEHGLREAVDFIYGDRWLRGKRALFKRLLRLEKLAIADLYYIGDEVDDVRVVNELGGEIVAVSWGYNDRRALDRMDPDWLVDSVPDLRKLLLET